MSQDVGKRVFGPRTRVAFLCLSGALLIAPAVVAVLLILRSESAPQLVVGLGAFVFVLVVSFFMMFKGVFLLIAWLKPRIRRKVETVYGVDVGGAPLVGLSPGSELRTYQGDTAWDAGFLVLAGGSMRFLGDVSSFELDQEQVLSVEPVALQLTGLKYPAVKLTWRASPDAQTHDLILEDWETRSLAGLKRGATALVERIESWWRGPASTSDLPNRLGLPPLAEEVKADPVRAAMQVGWGAMAAAGAVVIVLAAVVALVVALRERERFLMTDESPPLAMIAGMSVLGVVLFWVLAHAFQKIADRNKDQDGE